MCPITKMKLEILYLNNASIFSFKKHYCLHIGQQDGVSSHTLTQACVFLQRTSLIWKFLHVGTVYCTVNGQPGILWME